MLDTTYVDFNLFSIRVFNCGIIRFDPYILDELSSKTTLSNTTYSGQYDKHSRSQKSLTGSKDDNVIFSPTDVRISPDVSAGDVVGCYLGCARWTLMPITSSCFHTSDNSPRRFGGCVKCCL